MGARSPSDQAIAAKRQVGSKTNLGPQDDKLRLTQIKTNSQLVLSLRVKTQTRELVEESGERRAPRRQRVPGAAQTPSHRGGGCAGGGGGRAPPRRVQEDRQHWRGPRARGRGGTMAARRWSPAGRPSPEPWGECPGDGRRNCVPLRGATVPGPRRAECGGREERGRRPAARERGHRTSEVVTDTPRAWPGRAGGAAARAPTPVPRKLGLRGRRPGARRPGLLGPSSRTHFSDVSRDADGERQDADAPGQARRQRHTHRMVSMIS